MYADSKDKQVVAMQKAEVMHICLGDRVGLISLSSHVHGG